MNTIISSPSALRRRLASVLLLSLLCLAGAIFALAGTASAAVPGLNLVTSTSPLSSLDKNAVVTCPAGDQVLGVAGGITGGAGQVLADDWSQLNPTQAGVSGVEEDPFAALWDVRASALCADPLPGRVTVTSTSVANSVDKFVTATCPTGKQLVAPGADILSGRGDVDIEEMVPNLPTNSVTVLAHEEDPTGANWQARATAVCADPLPGRVRVISPPIASNSVSPKTTPAATCPAGTVLVGTGAETTGGAGEAAVESIDPNASLTGVTARAAEADPTTAAWTVSAFAVCADR